MANKTNGKENAGYLKKETIIAIYLLLGILFALAIVAITVLGVTLARYATPGTETGKDLPIAKWGVTTDVTGTLHVVDNDNVVDGKIAPGSQAYIDVVINLNGAEVAVDYAVEIKSITKADGSDITVDGLALEKVTRRNADNTADAQTLTETAGKYTGTLDLPGTSGSKTAFGADDTCTIRIYFKWTNDDTKNTAHTTVGNEAPTLSFKLTVDAEQHIDAAA